MESNIDNHFLTSLVPNSNTISLNSTKLVYSLFASIYV